MKIHEFQAKEIISRFGVPIPRGYVAKTVDEAIEAARKLPGDVYVVKAQIHAGGRGKGGGVKVSNGMKEMEINAASILGMQLVTQQTGPQGRKVKTLLIEEGMDIVSELYFSILIDRVAQKIVLLASTEGGMDIEEVAEKTPEKILKEIVDPALGLRQFQAQRLAFGLKVEQHGPQMIRQAASFFMGVYKAFVREDCSLLEINPVVSLLWTAKWDLTTMHCTDTRKQSNCEI